MILSYLFFSDHNSNEDNEMPVEKAELFQKDFLFLRAKLLIKKDQESLLKLMISNSNFIFSQEKEEMKLSIYIDIYNL